MPARILYPMPGVTVGGSHLSTIEIINSLDRGAFEPVIVLHKPDGLLGEHLRTLKVPYESAGHMAYPPSLPTVLPSILKARAFLKKHKIDIVHLDDGPPRYIWLYAAKLAGVRYVHMQRTIPGHNPEKWLGYRLPDAVIANSKLTGAMLPNVPNTPQAIIYPPVRLEFGPQHKDLNRELIFERLGLPRDAKLIVFVANIQDHKRPNIFIHMAAKLRQETDLDCRFALLGRFADGMEEPMRALVSHHNLEDVLTFEGFRSDSQIYASAADVMVAPGVNEAFGKSVVESMGLGTPVVAAGVNGYAEIVTHEVDGLLAVPDDVDDFTSNVLRILRDPDFAEKIARGGIARAKTFIQPRAAAPFEEIYRKLI